MAKYRVTVVTANGTSVGLTIPAAIERTQNHLRMRYEDRCHVARFLATGRAVNHGGILLFPDRIDARVDLAMGGRAAKRLACSVRNYHAVVPRSVSDSLHDRIRHQRDLWLEKWRKRDYALTDEDRFIAHKLNKLYMWLER